MVSRETVPTPPAPAAAQGVFASRLPAAERFAELLASDGIVRGVIGPREVPRLWERHLMNCALLGEAIPHGASVADIGSGAGLPGVVLAIARADLQVTLIEPLLRRTTFLEEVVAGIGLDNVEVRRARAEECHGGARYDIVTSRAVAPLGRLLEWSMPLVAPDGALVALKGRSLPDEIHEAGPVLRRLGCAEPEIVTLGGALPVESSTAVRVVWRDPSRVRWSDAPRTAGPERGGRTGRSTADRHRRRR